MSTTTLDTKTMEKELLDLEKKYWQAIKEKRTEDAARLTEFPCLVGGAKGVARIERDRFMEMMKATRPTLNDFQLKNTEVRLLNDDVGLVAYEVHETLTIDGKRFALDAADSSVWVRRGGKWLCAL